MKITREFSPADRYLYDFGLCSYANGWTQVDTAQDASYVGTWANPTQLLIFNYCEGDTTLKEAGTPEEFAAERLIPLQPVSLHVDLPLRPIERAPGVRPG